MVRFDLNTPPSQIWMERPDFVLEQNINSYKKEISEDEQEEVRDWYLENIPENCVKIENFDSNWIGKVFGTKYFNATSLNWDGYFLCIGENYYVKILNSENR